MKFNFHSAARPGVIGLIGVFGVLLTTAGCGSARRDAPLVGELRTDDPQVAAGERAFMANCYQCHPGGRAGVGPALNNKPAPGGLIKVQVRKGLGEMPSFSPDRISDPQLDDLVKYVIALRAQRG